MNLGPDEGILTMSAPLVPEKQNTLEVLESVLLTQCHRITLRKTTEEAMNSYGICQKYECEVELIKRRCDSCKVQENGNKLDDFCPVNGRHHFKNGFVVVYRDVDQTLSGVIGKILKQISSQE